MTCHYLWLSSHIQNVLQYAKHAKGSGGMPPRKIIFKLQRLRSHLRMGSWKRRIWLDADADTDIFKKHFYIYITVIFHT